MMIVRLYGGTSYTQGWSGGDWGTALTGRVIPQGGGNFIQGGGSNDNNVWFRGVSPFVGNGEKGGRDTHLVT